MKESFYSHGKLLLFGEYAVLDGALALAVPSRPGQHLEVSEGARPGLSWTSLDHEGKAWFQTHFTESELRQNPEAAFPQEIRQRLLFILHTARQLVPGFLSRDISLHVETRLEFPREWGLGTSSTLLSNIAEWAGADPYALLGETLGGSGYDLACARAKGPLFYRLQNGVAEISEAPFQPDFTDSLRLVYLGQKQDSREGIRRYRERKGDKGPLIREISGLSSAMSLAPDLGAFMEGMRRSEALISQYLGLPKVADLLFPDFDGVVKSLGAWGGDFVLAAGGSNPQVYFHEKGYPVQMGYSELILGT